jgi:hypothetical protein
MGCAVQDHLHSLAVYLSLQSAFASAHAAESEWLGVPDPFMCDTCCLMCDTCCLMCVAAVSGCVAGAGTVRSPSSQRECTCRLSRQSR